MTLRSEGFEVVDGARMREILVGEPHDWVDCAASWDDLRLDGYMADGGTYRRRRHALFLAPAGGAIERRPHGPHWQGLEYNPLNEPALRDVLVVTFRAC